MSAVGTTNEQMRHAWVEASLRALPAGLRLLDAGAGEQRYRKHCGHLQYVAQDAAQYDPKANPTALQMPNWTFDGVDLVCDIGAIPVPDESFDAVLCTEVFEHIPDPLSAIREFSRLLKPGGILLLTAPFCSLTHFAPFHFSSGFSRYFFETHLPARGLRIVEMTPNGNYFEYLAQEMRRLPSIAQRYANRRMGLVESLIIQSALRILDRCTRRDKGSAELLTFGYHVRAVKDAAAIRNNKETGL